MLSTISFSKARKKKKGTSPFDDDLLFPMIKLDINKSLVIDLSETI